MAEPHGFLGFPYFHRYDPPGFGGLSHLDEPSICAAHILDAAAGTAVFFLGSDPWHDSMSQHLALSAKAGIWIETWLVIPITYPT